MDKRQLKYVNGLMLDWGAWLKGGMTCQGVFSTSQWAEGKPVAPVRRGNRRNRVIAPNPKETRTTRPKTPCLRIAYREERTHRAVIALPTLYLPLICCLYLKGCNFYETSVLLGVTSKKVGKMRYKLLKTIDNMV